MDTSVKIKKGIAWNVIAFGVAGVLGIIGNIFIAMYGNAKILGIYNQMTAFYMVLGQIASWGMQHSSIYFLTRAQDDKEKNELNSTLLFCALLMGTVLAILWYIILGIIGNSIYQDTEFVSCLQSITFALTLFGVNKCMAGILNAYEKMAQYACMLMMRYVIIIGVIVISVFLNLFFEVGIYCFLIAEIVVFVMGFLFGSRLFAITIPGRKYIKSCMIFGGRAMLGGVVSEINTKADVLVLGMFVPNEMVGVYSFAAMIVEGFLSIVNVIKINLNPFIARTCYEQKWSILREYSAMLKIRARVIALVSGMAIICGYFFMCKLFDIEMYLKAIPQLSILLLGVSYAAPQILRGNVLTFLGKPQRDSLIAILTVGMNILLNFILIPRYQCYGAAVATLLSYIMHACIVEYAHNREIVVKESTDVNHID